MTRKILIIITAAALLMAAFMTSCTQQGAVQMPTTEPTSTSEEMQSVEPTSTNERQTVSAGLIYSSTDAMEQLIIEQVDNLEIDNVDVDVYKREVSTDTISSTVQELSDNNCIIIFCVNVEANDVIAIADKYKNINFEIYDSIVDVSGSSNISQYSARGYQQQYINGMVAGFLTDKNNVGFIAPLADDYNILLVNAFALGVAQVNSDAMVHLGWVQENTKDELLNEAFDLLQSKNCDIILQEYITDELYQLALQEDILLMGNGLVKYNVLNYMQPKFSVFMSKQIEALINNTYKKYDMYSGWRGIESGVIDPNADYEALSDEQRLIISNKIDQMRNGEWDVFTGPIIDIYGTEIVTTGEKLPDEDLKFMLWYVENIEALAPPAG